MTIYRLVFEDRALRAFRKLDTQIQKQARKKLRERLSNPRVQSDRLSKYPNCYKIKLRKSGFRLVYQVHDAQIVVLVIAVGKRDSGKRDVYDDVASVLDAQ